MKKGWEMKKLGDMSKIMYGHTAKTSSGSDGVKYLRITDIQNGSVDWNSVPNCPYLDGNFEKYELKYGDIVFARTGATTGKSYLVQNPPAAVFASYLIRVQTNQEEISPEFLSMFFQSASYWNVIEAGISGSAQGGFNAKKLGGIPIPIPPLPEQKKIVTLLDAAFAKIDQAKANIEKNIENAKELFQSKLNEIFNQKGDGWEEKSLGEVVKIIGGGTPSKKEIEYYNGQIPWATVRDMKNDLLKITEHKITDAGLRNSSSNLIPKGELIIATRVGLGKACILNQNTAINQDLKGLIPYDSNLNRFFLLFWFKSIADNVKRDGKGMTVKGVNLNYVKKINIMIPPYKEQKKVVDLALKLKNNSENYISKLFNKLQNLEDLKKSLLKKAFAGELT